MLKRTFLKLLAVVFPVSAIAARFPEPKPYWHDYIDQKAGPISVLRFATVDQLYASMNSVLPVGPPTEIYWSMTGEPYIEYALRTGADENAEARLCTFMWRTFIAQLHKQDDRSRARLYWRIKPEVAEYADEDYKPSPRQVRFYARYLISSRPALVADTPQASQDLLRLAGEQSWQRDSSHDVLIPVRI